MRTAGSAPLWSSVGPISLLALLRARRWLFGRQRNFNNFISSLGRCRWWYDNRWLAAWHSPHFESTLSAETFRPSANIRSSVSGFGLIFALAYSGVINGIISSRLQYAQRQRQSGSMHVPHSCEDDLHKVFQPCSRSLLVSIFSS